MPIRVLPPEVARLIAAGEVVTRPADVVKELVENAIDAIIARRSLDPDAEAPFLRIEIRSGGLDLIRVTDNGCGISPDELPLAVQRHATSKVATADDLEMIATLGFRGEALASIAAVADLQILSRVPSASAGTLLSATSAGAVEVRSQGAAIGTSVTVRRLFANVPARRKFLRSATGEASQIVHLISQFALAYPEIRFALANDDRVVLQTSGRGSLRDALVDVLGAKVAERLVPVDRADDDVGVSGFVSTPELSRPTRSGLTFFVNRRWIRSQMLVRAVEDAFPQAMLGGRHPIAVLNVTIPPPLVDVNVHPSKVEVRFADDRRLYHQVREAVRAAVGDLAPLPSIGFESPTGVPVITALEGSPPGPTPEASTAWTTTQPSPAPVVDGGPAMGPASVDGGPTPAAPTSANDSVGPAPAMVRLSVLRPVGQVQGTYIVAEGADGVYFVDQHAAHEAVLYQQFCDARAGHQVARQDLLQPLPVEITARQAVALASHRVDLERVGFLAEPFGERTALVRGVPAVLSRADVAQAFLEVLDALAAPSDGPTDARAFDPVCARLACRAAVKEGDTLTTDEMRALLEQVERQPQLWNYCPHGRPIFLRLSASQLARDFRRK